MLTEGEDFPYLYLGRVLLDDFSSIVADYSLVTACPLSSEVPSRLSLAVGSILSGRRRRFAMHASFSPVNLEGPFF